MIEPSQRTLRRRSKELRLSAERELSKDADTAGLLLFYAAECALKAAYLDRHQLADTAALNAQAKAARSFKHNLTQLIEVLNIPATAVGPLPALVLQRTRAPIAHQELHEAWRYGEKVVDVSSITDWLKSIVIWARQSA